MRVLIAVRACEGGIRKHITDIADAALRAGHEVTIATSLKQSDAAFQEWSQKLERDGQTHSEKAGSIRLVNWVARSAPGPWDISAIYSLYRLLSHDNRNRIAIVHAHGAKAGMATRVLKWICGMIGTPFESAIIYTPHGGSIHAMFHPLFNWLFALIERALSPLTDLILFESHYTYRQYVERIGPPACEWSINPNGVTVPNEQIDRWPEKLGYNTVLHVGAFGLLRPIKGYRDLIQAVGALRSEGLKIELTIYGIGRDQDRLSELIQSLGAEAFIRIVHGVADTGSAMRQMHVVVQPSLFESFGLVTAEASALGVSVISTRVGGLTDLIEHEKTGLLIEPRSPQAIADAIRRLIEAPDWAYEMRVAAREKMRREFSTDRMLSAVLAEYRRLESTNS